MFRHYASDTISNEQLDEMIEEGRRAEGRSYWSEADVIIVAEDADGDCDEDFDGYVWAALDAAGMSNRDDDVPEADAPEVDADDLLAAADMCAITIGAIYDAPDRAHKVIQLDEDAITNANAWAVLHTLPKWVRWRLQDIVDSGTPLTAAG